MGTGMIGMVCEPRAKKQSVRMIRSGLDLFASPTQRPASAVPICSDRFVARALELDLDVRLYNHPTGQHGFDVRDDDARSREIIRAALDFFASAL